MLMMSSVIGRILSARPLSAEPTIKPPVIKHSKRFSNMLLPPSNSIPWLLKKKIQFSIKGTDRWEKKQTNQQACLKCRIAGA